MSKKKILRFSAEWCGPCKALASNLEIANLSTPVEYINIDEAEELCTQYKIRGVPTLVLVENEVEVGRFVGVKSPSELKTWAGE